MLIAHRCTKCKHPDYRRREEDAEGKRGPCDCSCKCTPGKPGLLPTFNAAGRKVERVIEPGGKFGNGVDNGFGGVDGIGLRTCDCADCKTFHEQLSRLGPAAAVEKPPAVRPSPAALREWAAEAGIDCPPVGRVPARVVEAYAAAHNQ